MTPKHHPETSRCFLGPARGGEWSFLPRLTQWESAGSELAVVRMRSVLLLQLVLAPLLHSTEFPWVRPVTSHMDLVPSTKWSQHLLAWPSSAVPQIPRLKQAAVLAPCDAEPEHRNPAQLGISASALPAPPADKLRPLLGRFILTPNTFL